MKGYGPKCYMNQIRILIWFMCGGSDLYLVRYGSDPPYTAQAACSVETDSGQSGQI
ncbi:hypothetical protein HanRHA438_Chr01g0044981 [Helianthus annuus]|nr:hypothetical protein HanIR_Chr01g0048691 [Helianthus annuus]KAJ0950035.1 hypothetical protein HanRHA438_Chr01g0044981 [Helianthus annuus]